jgi:hypothetical protein
LKIILVFASIMTKPHFDGPICNTFMIADFTPLPQPCFQAQRVPGAKNQEPGHFGVGADEAGGEWVGISYRAALPKITADYE